MLVTYTPREGLVATHLFPGSDDGQEREDREWLGPPPPCPGRHLTIHQTFTHHPLVVHKLCSSQMRKRHTKFKIKDVYT